MSWETVTGLEIHVQLATNSKIFSGSDTSFGAEANTQASLIDLGMPGVLPVLNQEAVNMAIRFGLGVDAEIGRTSIFARKNYFYPDLPKIRQQKYQSKNKDVFQSQNDESSMMKIRDKMKSLDEESFLDSFLRNKCPKLYLDMIIKKKMELKFY